jgi:hypothetical protein
VPSVFFQSCGERTTYLDDSLYEHLPIPIFHYARLVLIINIPFWISQQQDFAQGVSDMSGSKDALAHENIVAGMCAALHLLALDTWWRPDCIRHGPDVYYASVIWSIYLAWAVLRWIEVRLTNALLGWCSDGERIFPALRKANLWQRVGQAVHVVVYNQPSTQTALLLLALYWVIKIALLCAVCILLLVIVRPKEGHPYDEVPQSISPPRCILR